MNPIRELHRGHRGGPAGLMAAETAASAGMQVDVYERMGSSDENSSSPAKVDSSHPSEPFAAFVAFGARQAKWRAACRVRSDALRTWAPGLASRPLSAVPAGFFPAT